MGPAGREPVRAGSGLRRLVDLVSGTTRDAFSPRRAVRRDQMAMMTRMLTAAAVQPRRP